MLLNEFKTFHPVVNFTYFLFVIGFSCFFMHPVCLGISLVSGFIYLVVLKGRKTVRINLIYMLVMFIIMALINPAFNHEGITVVGYLPSGNPLTLESMIYGVSTAVMIVAVVCHFSCYSEVMTSDKFIYLFGRIIPTLSLIISMTLKFVPNFLAQLKIITNSQKCMGRDLRSGGIIRRVKNGLNILSILTTWSLENSVEMADSMKSRGYGLPKRTSFSIFKLDMRDKKVLVCILGLGIYTFFGSIMGVTRFSYFPAIKFTGYSVFDISVFLAYFLLCMCPVIIEILEVRRWKA